MFKTIQTIYFPWGYDPSNLSVFIAELSLVYCCLVCLYTGYIVFKASSGTHGIVFSQTSRSIIFYAFWNGQSLLAIISFVVVHWSNALHFNDAMFAINWLSLIKFASAGTPVKRACKNKLKIVNPNLAFARTTTSSASCRQKVFCRKS